MIILGGTMRATIAWAMISMLGVILVGCAPTEVPPHLRPLTKETMMQLGKRGMEPAQPIFVRIFKEESELEVWKQRADGRHYLFKVYPICNWSGELGPKVQQGDRQAPEGFYFVNRQQMNPNSQFHLAFNLGYPNVYDRVHGRTGEFLMVHGKCKSAGCYAMTDGLIEEIYALARESFIGGQETIHVHAFPFRMTDANIRRHHGSPHARFWTTLREGYEYFETTRQLPSIAVCERRYLVNARWRDGSPRVDPASACPAYERPRPEPFVPTTEQTAEAPPLVVVGPKTRTAANIGVGVPPPEDGLATTAAATRMSLGGAVGTATAATPPAGATTR